METNRVRQSSLASPVVHSTEKLISGLISKLLLTLSILVPCQLQALNIQGSNLLEPLAPYLSEHNASFKGSYLAFQALKQDHADLIIAADAEDLHLPDVSSVPFAYQAVIVATHKSNPLDSISLEQLADIFGPARQFKWRMLTSEPTYKFSSILPFISKQNLAFPIFFNKCLDRQGFNSHVVVHDKDADIIHYLKRNPDAIGIMAMPHPDVKVLKIDDIEYASGDYPLKLPFNFYFKDKNTVAPVLSQLSQDQVKSTLEDASFLQ